MKNISKGLWGIVLIGIGLVIGLNSFGVTDIDIFFDGWWTLFIIVPCFIGLLDFEKGDKVGDIIGLLIGVALLLVSRDILEFDFIAKLILPTILVIVGLSMIFNNTLKTKISEKVREGKKNGLEAIVATFAGQKVDKTNEKFEGASLDAIFGSIVLDLRKAKLYKETTIEASAIFGGIEIIVPNDVNVKVKSTPIFGGVSNRITNSEENKETIYIEAFSMFGGVDIK